MLLQSDNMHNAVVGFLRLRNDILHNHRHLSADLKNMCVRIATKEDGQARTQFHESDALLDGGLL